MSDISHWLKPDHFVFLCIGPCILLGRNDDRFLALGFGLWVAAALLDLFEDED